MYYRDSDSSYSITTLVIFVIILILLFYGFYKSIPTRVKVTKIKPYTCVETTYKLKKDEIFIICGKEVIK